MKAITLTQPWATLIATGHKRVETRSWPTQHRGPIAIHAAKGLKREALGTEIGGLTGLREVCGRFPFYVALAPAAENLPRGAIVATANLITCVPQDIDYWRGQIPALDGFELARYEHDFGSYGPGRFCFALADVVALEQPIEYSPSFGLGLWDLPDEVLR